MNDAVPNRITVPLFNVKFEGVILPQTTNVPPSTVTFPVKDVLAEMHTFIPELTVTVPFPEIVVEQLLQSSPFNGS